MSTTRLTQNTQSVSPASVNVDLPAENSKPNSRAASKPEKPLAGRGIDEKMSATLEQILDILRGSTIAEERGKDVESKFWATYKRVSIEYDDSFLERANDNMAIILTFRIRLVYSQRSTTFIVGMQPNPGVTTNVLMVQLIQIIANGPNAGIDIGNLSSSTDYSSSTVWMQTLAYASLAFSVLAAFGAVMGKQWLNSYKAARGRGSLEERGLQRQRKLDGLEHWHLQTVLGAFLVLLQISLFLFGLSLSASMWAQQPTIASVVICTTALGILFYVATILISVLHPDSPFQTAGSALIRAIPKQLSKTISEFILYLITPPNFPLITPLVRYKPTSTVNNFSRSSAIRWMLETSTNPEVVEAAAAMIHRVQWPPKLDASAVYARLIDICKTLADRSELYVTCGKAMAHLHVQSVKTNSRDVDSWFFWGSLRNRSRFIRDSFMDARFACSQPKNTDNEAQRKNAADARTALRTMVVHGLSSGRLCLPDDERLIWRGDLRWRHGNGSTPSCDEFDWLIDYLVRHEEDDETEGDALLALSAMHALGSSARRPSYIMALIRCMAPTRSSRVRHAALKAVSGAGEELASITNDSTLSRGIDATHLDELSRVLLSVVRPNHDQTMQENGSATSFVESRDCCYLRLIFALTKNDEWCQRLTRDGHVEWCISLHDKVLASSLFIDSVCLAGILLRTDPSSKNISPNPAQEKWWMLMQHAWNRFYLPLPSYSNLEPEDMSIIEALQALVIMTRQNLPNNRVAGAEIAKLARYVHDVLQNLKRTQGWLTQADARLDAALLAVQGLYDELSSYAEHGNTSQGDNGVVES
ncbi:hypothetical protein AZE42_11467 [Rhizopogon vesiculosus]|uniref:DUF6535 domain-containing protein n=1 Tax=Rhizopogon vesiculosus TaxID=180088 RepID=A0A1J8PS69_9AGAM|nr:hypothetical protein AZE42_11467 [Rhizopogon vesiculosus]